MRDSWIQGGDRSSRSGYVKLTLCLEKSYEIKAVVDVLDAQSLFKFTNIIGGLCKEIAATHRFCTYLINNLSTILSGWPICGRLGLLIAI